MYDLLKDLRIVEGSAFVAAPLGGMTLAQLGADVIRFDPIGGGLDYRRWPVTEQGRSLYWAGLNKGKRSIAVDLGSPEGKELVVALITGDTPDAGIFLTNFPQSDWLGYPALKQRREDLIMVHVQGNPDGSSAVDYTINAATGFPYTTGPAEHTEPVNHTFPAWDALTGINAALAVVVAERQRRLSGTGQLISLALSDIAFSMVGNLGYIAEVQVNGVERPSVGCTAHSAIILKPGTAMKSCSWPSLAGSGATSWTRPESNRHAGNLKPKPGLTWTGKGTVTRRRTPLSGY